MNKGLNVFKESKDNYLTMTFGKRNTKQDTARISWEVSATVKKINKIE